MTTSFYNGVSGLMSFQSGIDIWGDNIANVNTPGYKESLPEFSTLFASTLNTNSSPTSDIGLGSYLSSSAKDMSIGSLINTDNPFDLAITDKGWLAVKYGNSTFYTRNGSFTRDAQGYLTNDSGAYLLVANANNLIKTNNGYIIDKNIATDNLLPTDNLSPISLPDNVILPAVATQNVTLQTNLNDDEIIFSTKPVTENIDFSAMYNKDGKDLKIRNGDNLLFGFGEKVNYNNGTLNATYCFNDDEKDGNDINIDFTLNDKEIKLTIPDGSTKEDIANSIANALQANGFNAIASNGNLTIYTQDKFILVSNDNYLTNTAAAVLSYSDTPQNEFEFANMKDFTSILQNLSSIVYPDITNVYLDNDGRIVIQNNSKKVLNSYIEAANNSNEYFLENLGRLGNEIYPNTASKSFEFLANSQDFGGYIIDNNGNKNPVSINFTKQKVLDNQTIIWQGRITINTPSGNITNTQEFTFDSFGKLINPTEINLNNIKFNFKLTYFSKTDNAINYTFTQDGVEEGFLNNYQITDDGKIIGIFSNAEDIILGQIPVFHFQNDQGLESIGDSMFMETPNSSKAILYTDENGNYIPSKIKSSMLESSNVNFSEAMTELIVTQKAFQASAKTVTTSDEMIQKAINLKR
ncbi:flagellar hook protein FlgE [Caminibacter profundus]